MSSRTLLVTILSIHLFFSFMVSTRTSNTENYSFIVKTIPSMVLNPYTFEKYIAQREKAEAGEITVEESVYSEEGHMKMMEVNVEKIRREEKQYNETQKDRIRISFAGDCTIGWDETSSYYHSFPYIFKKEGENYGYFFQKVTPIFHSDDLTLVNLETTLTDGKKKAQKKFRFKGDPSYVSILKEGSVEMVNISNNHIYDYLQKGFDDTIKTLVEGNILYSGEGHIAYCSIRGIKIASLGYVGWSIDIKDKVSKDIQGARENADIILVSFHWGEERKNYPNTTQTTLGHFAIDQGADIVVGHHPHVIQGIEKYNGKYIVYSLGNFSFGGNKNPYDKDTFIFQCDFFMENKKLRKAEGTIIPSSISSEKNFNNYQPVPLEGEDKNRILDRIYLYSRKLKYGISQEEIKGPA